MPEPDPPDWQPLFEPYDFNEEHAPLTIEGYKLVQAELQSWAERATTLRAAIVD